MVYHPNFPSSLSITPNVAHFTHEALRCASEDGDEDAFGIDAQREAISRYGIAGRVWEAAYPLCAYVDSTDDDNDVRCEFDPPFVDDLREPLGVIELGSGTGVVAASVASTIRRATTTRPDGLVIATDLPDVCPLLQRNFRTHTRTSANVPAGSYRNGNYAEEGAAVFVRPLAWGDLGHAIAIAREFFDVRWLTHVVCSDLVYFPELLGPLLRTLIHLTSPSCVPSGGPSVKIVISYKIRSLPKETPFWSAFGLWFSFRPVLARYRVRPTEGQIAPLEDSLDALEPWRRFGTDEDTDRIFVFIAYRRPESIAWYVPETDKDLIEGVGARDTTAKKGDDTFETILFMAMGMDDTGE